MSLRAKLFSALLLLIMYPATVLASETVYFYNTDPAGTPIVMTDSSANVVWQAQYKPFGEEWSTSGNAINNKRFIGKDKDEETGLNYFGARYLFAPIGRFISTDPHGPVDEWTSKSNYGLLTNSQELNPYAYSINNPYRYVDSNGKDIAFIVYPEEAGGNGHAVLFFQNGNGQWYKFSQGSAGDPTISGKPAGNIGYLLGLHTPAGVSIQPANGPEKGSVIIKTTSRQDASISQRALKSQFLYNSGKERYDLYTNNCKDAAVNVVNKSGAGLQIPNPWYLVTPNSWFKHLKKWHDDTH